MATIHFYDLCDFTRELTTGAVVRVEGIYKAQASEKTPALVNTVAEVHVRAIRAGDVLAWCYPVGDAQVIRGHGETEPKEAELTLTNRLGRAEDNVKTYLESLVMDVRPGLIDITPAEPVRGTWAGFDAWINARADEINKAKRKGADRAETQ